jgi:GT2 family glycosyltransferase
MPFPIMIKVWAGTGRHDFRYISHSLPSLLASDLPANARVILIDDRSTDPRLQPFVTGLAAEHANVEVWTNPRQMGPNEGHAYNVPLLFEKFPEAPYIVLCDDDVVYHPGWLQRLIRVYEEAKAVGLRGVFTALNVPARPSSRSVRLPTSEVLVKPRQMALNWLVPREVYEAVGPFRDVGVAYDTEYTDRMIALGFPVICLKPSYVQNIGYHGAYQTDDSLTAKDFVGRMGWKLGATARVYAVLRHARRLAHAVYDRMPESGLKRLIRRVRHGDTMIADGESKAGS